MATTTTYTTFAKLNARGDEAVLVVKLMMAFNDLAIANEGLAAAKAENADKPTEKSRGAGMYFIRLQASHLYEGMDIVDSIAANARLKGVIESGSDRAKAAFARLLELRTDKAKKNKFEQFVGRLRNNLTFHYDEYGDLVKRAMTRREATSEGNTTSIIRGSEPYSWRFTAADDVIDTAVCREIWKIPDGADVRAEADAGAMYGHDIFVDFADFASELITRYVRDGA